MATSLLRKASPRFRIGVFLILGLGMLAAFLFFSFQQGARPSVDKFSPTEIILQKVSAHVSLPSGQPVLTRVQDVELLRRENPSFYQKAEVGDWILSFPSVVILYRLTTDRVIAMLPLQP